MTQLEIQTQSPVATSHAAVRLPNFLYIGTSKAGSTWIYHVLAEHPQVFIAPAKGVYFFDAHFDRGLDWYGDHFRKARDETIVGEISHSYLFSIDAAQRIAQRIPEAKLMVCLRDPIERAFSAYLDLVKNGRFIGSFEEALEADPDLKQRGSYGSHIANYLDHFQRDQIHVAIFDDLKANPQQFADDLFSFLELPPLSLNSAQRKKMMPAARPRSRWLAQAAKSVARGCERWGFGGIRGRVKRSRIARHLLYRPLSKSELPSIDPNTRNALQDYFRPEIERLDELLGTSQVERWNLR